VHRPENGKKHKQRRVAQIAGNASSQKEKITGIHGLMCLSFAATPERWMPILPSIKLLFFMEFFFNNFVSLPPFYSL
jgi:hypothetical protein